MWPSPKIFQIRNHSSLSFRLGHAPCVSTCLEGHSKFLKMGKVERFEGWCHWKQARYGCGEGWSKNILYSFLWMILPQRKKCQVYRGKFQVYSTCDNQAILPSDAIFWAHPQFWWIYTLVYVASIILKLDETWFSHWDEVIRCWFVTCWPHPKTRFQNCKRNAISLIWWMAQTIFPAERLLCAHKFDHMSNFHSGSKLW